MLGVRRPEEIAEDECLWWDQLDDLAECQRDLMPTAENPTVLKIPEYHLEHMHVKKGPAYFHREALACGGVGTHQLRRPNATSALSRS